MTVIIANYSHKYMNDTEGLLVFEDTSKGLEAAIHWINSSIPNDDHVKQYYKNCSTEIGQDSRTIVAQKVSDASYACELDCREFFPCNFQFRIFRETVRGE